MSKLKIKIGRETIGYVTRETAGYIEFAPVGGGPIRRLNKPGMPRGPKVAQRKPSIRWLVRWIGLCVLCATAMGVLSNYL